MGLRGKRVGGERRVNGTGLQRELDLRQISRIAVTTQFYCFDGLFSPALGHRCIEGAATDALTVILAQKCP
ncbi:hypothetical protein SDC9_173272 [bioreactor metagenome]|uniref:Uncharacterized protein n=1 Tax=bioreactor metagenome TaxID=1076179 RepID=A0A645GPH9_9ZZZZ